MRPSDKFVRIIGKKRYSVGTATLLACDDFWDGNCRERHGRNTFLYKTPNGAYFEVNLTQWQGEKDTLEPITREDAISLWEGRLTEHYVKYAEAFPSEEVTDA